MVSQSPTWALQNIIIKSGRETGWKSTPLPIRTILFLKKRSNYQLAAPFRALTAPDRPCSVQVRVQALLLHALWEFLICVSQVRLLVWLWLLQHEFTVGAEHSEKANWNTDKAQSCSSCQQPCFTRCPISTHASALSNVDFLPHCLTTHIVIICPPLP